MEVAPRWAVDTAGRREIIAVVLGIHNPKRMWLVAWLGGAGVGVANGVLREATLAKVLDEDDANRTSAAAALVAFALYFDLLQGRWPLRERAEAIEVGAAWLTLTVGFEFGFGRAVAKKSWKELGADYNLRRGRLWPVVLASIALGPELARRRSQR